MKNIKYILTLFLAGMFVVSCDQELVTIQPDPDPTNPIETPEPDPGDLDFSKFVSIGNSLTAGVQAGTLFDEGQANSLPSILHTQFDETMDAGDFVQPDINSEFGYTGGGPGMVFGRLLLQGDPPSPTPQPSDDAAIPSPLNPAFDYTGPTNELNNFGVGGILLGQALIPDTGDWSQFGVNPAVNPYYARFASVPGTSTILGDALSALPTFFLFWLGNNDILGYAASGGSGAVPITDPAAFDFQYTAAMQTLTLTPGFENLEGVVCNIPPVLLIPYFRTVPWNPIPMDQATADLTNLAYGEYNQGLQAAVAIGAITVDEAALRTINFVASPTNGAVIDDESLTQDVDISAALMLPPGSVILPNIRQTNDADLFTLPAGSVLGTELIPGDPTTTIGVGVPVEDQYVLIPTEQGEIEAARAAYNASIPAILTGLGVDDRVAVADVSTALTNFILAGGTFQDGVLLAPTLAPPYAAWSEDGVHPNSRGYAFTANIIIDAINGHFGAEIPRARINEYATTALPIP